MATLERKLTKLREQLVEQEQKNSFYKAKNVKKREQRDMAIMNSKKIDCCQVSFT